MALLFMDSFDHYVTADLTEKWTVSTVGNGTQAISAANGRRSTASLRMTRTSLLSTNYLSVTLAPGDPTTCLVGAAFKISAAPAFAMQILAVIDTATTQIGLRLNTDLTLSVLRGPIAGTVLGTTSASLSVGVVAYLELKVKIHDTTGTVDLRVNGASVLALTSQDTQQSATTQWTRVALGQFDAGSNQTVAVTEDYDDVYILDGSGSAPWNAFLGDVRVDVRTPTGAGATTGWTPSTGANWENVDDAAPDDDTTYNAAASAGLTDTFVVQDAPVVGATIYGVQVCLSAKKTDVGLCSLAPVVRHSSTNYPGTAQNPGTTYAYLTQVYATNPGTSAAWVEADFNAAEFGYTRTA